jgi:hypothetical protein
MAGHDMAELIRQFSTLTQGADGTQYIARVYGEQRRDRVWIGWIEFSSLADGRAMRSQRQTEKLNRDALAYWAAGLERHDLEGALTRASHRGALYAQLSPAERTAR